MEKRLWFLILPGIVVTIIIYAFVTDYAVGPRFFTDENYDRFILLPTVITEPVPLNQYSLFHLNHFYDLFQLIIFYSPIAIFGFNFIGCWFYKQINWNAPEVLILGMLLVVFGIFFFIFNPLLGVTLIGTSC